MQIQWNQLQKHLNLHGYDLVSSAQKMNETNFLFVLKHIAID